MSAGFRPKRSRVVVVQLPDIVDQTRSHIPNKLIFALDEIQVKCHRIKCAFNYLGKLWRTGRNSWMAAIHFAVVVHKRNGKLHSHSLVSNANMFVLRNLDMTHSHFVRRWFMRLCTSEDCWWEVAEAWDVEVHINKSKRIKLRKIPSRSARSTCWPTMKSSASLWCVRVSDGKGIAYVETTH